MIKRSLFYFLFLALINTVSCKLGEDDIVGKWTFHQSNEESQIKSDRKMQLEFLANGEARYYLNGNRHGIGYYYYRISGDTIFWTNVHKDSLGKIDTAISTSFYFRVKNDSLFLRDDESSIVYLRDE